MSSGSVRDTPYKQTLDYLYTRLPMFSRIGAAAIKKDLFNTLALCEALGNPERRFKTVHIAGTNGKGSTSHMLAAVFQEAGYRTGLYTSPHLVDFRERIRIDGKPVSQDFITDFVVAHKALIERIEPSFFEITVGMAFTAFAHEEVDIAIIETGLGGRLDSTNVITPELSIITNIGLDHTDLLGDTIAGIAFEKAGIIKPGVPVLIGQYDPEALPVFQAIARERQAPLHLAWEGFGEVTGTQALQTGDTGMTYLQHSGGSTLHFRTDLSGSFQQFNIRTVLAAVQILSDLSWNISPETAVRALARVRDRTGLRGRWDVLQARPLIVADVAHNPDGIATVMEEWKVAVGDSSRHHIITGFVRDKDVQAALSLFPRDAVFHFCAANIPRALPAGELADIAAAMGLQGTVHSSVREAVLQTVPMLREDIPLLITGSFFIVGEAMEALDILP